VSAGGFPEPPTGSPGGVRGAARAIGKAGAALEAVGFGLHGASGALAADWQGWAAASYQSCVTGLAQPLRIGADQFAECEAAISAYADSLERAQDEIKRLHALWVDAKAREAAALSQYNALSMQLASAKPKEVDGIQSDLSNAASAASGASGEAAELVRKAQEELERFEQESQRHANVLSGSDPFSSGALSLGPGAGLFGGAASALSFGVPPSGLGHLNGVITVQHPTRTVAKGPGEWLLGGGPLGGDYKQEEYDRESTNIPGDYGNWWAMINGRHPDALEDDNSLINPVGLAAGGVAGVGRTAITNTAKSIAKGVGLSGVDDAARQAYKKAYDDVVAGHQHHQEMRETLIRARHAGEMAAANVRAEATERQAQIVEQALEQADRAGLPLPPGAKEFIPWGIRAKDTVRAAALVQLVALRERIAQVEGKTAAGLVKMIDRVLGTK
jgi:hypothetical protein